MKNNYHKHITKSGKVIEVWDNLFSFAERSKMFAQMRDIPFQFWSAYDTLITDQSSSFIIKSPWKKEDLYNFGIFDLPGADPLINIFKEYHFHRAWVNLQTPIDRLRYHSDMFDPGYKSMLFYLNLHWDQEWHAPTVFRSDDLSEVEFISDFVPGRVVVFDSNIPHKATQAPLESQQYRFTLNSVWKKKND
jgi:hypothetical protein